MSTVRASNQGLSDIDRARRRKGWLKQSEIWCRMAQTSRATLKRFWRREAIDQGTFIAICQAVGIHDWETAVQLDAAASNLHLCLSAMPDVPVFFGRTTELKQLTEWSCQCRLIAVWGMGGIGKTSLVVEWVESLIRSGAAEQQFEAIFWRSLHAHPALEPLAKSLAEPFPEPQTLAFDQILSVLQQHRVLLVLDNWEALLGGATAGKTKVEFEAFSTLFQQFGKARHKSYVIVISSEKPAELTLLEGMNPSIKALKLGGMGQDAISLLQHRGLQAEPIPWQTLIQLYRGHPLALNMIASLIQDLCQGSTKAFLEMNTIVVHQLDRVLEERIRCLSSTELALLKILAQSGQPASSRWLQSQLAAVSQSQMLELLLSLERRCLLEILSDETVCFALSPVVQKYVSQHMSRL